LKNINSHRVFHRNTYDVRLSGDYVLYWMHSNRRLYWNFALEYAVAWANKLNKPLVILEGLNVDYPWAADRYHAFMIDGMQEKAQEAAKRGIAYYTYLEPQPGSGKGIIETLASRACMLISDEYPVFIMRRFNEIMANRVNIPYITVDSNGIIPLGITEKAPYAAFLFRKIVQKRFVESWSALPKEDPLTELQQKEVQISQEIIAKWPQLMSAKDWVRPLLTDFPINHQVGPLSYPGNRKEGLDRLERFVQQKLHRYGNERNDPDADAASRLSSFLHFGTLSEHEIVARVLREQPANWSYTTLVDAKGKSEGFFGGHDYIEKFLDEIITWRGVGFHFAHHTPDYDKYESLPDWAIASLEAHKKDPRPELYSLEQLEAAQTSDPIWNAAQRELVQEGIVHNYLRMLWGKKILEWTPDPETALAYMIELNNKYAIDGRDPNSYSGIFWCLGRFDRPWFERPIYGSIRYMTTESARKKLKMKEYLIRWSGQS
jgi:deoxyribodipyrimidine photo-lyase